MTFDSTYLDWAATTPLCEEAAAAMSPFMEPGPAGLAHGANANSLHSPGRAAFSDMEDARMRIARSLNASRPSELVFMSGATEANNMAVLGIIGARVKAERQRGNASYVPHFITSAIEHGAILSLLPLLRSRGCRVTVLDVDRDGMLPAGRLEEALESDTALVSVMAANNEVGSVQDVRGLAARAHAKGVPFHTDATQAVGKVAVDFAAWAVDAASFSAHKICGPKGIGALYLKTGCACEPLIVGGGQEQGRRSGTQNVMGEAGFAAACESAVAMLPAESVRLAGLRDRLYRELCAMPGVEPTVDCKPGDGRFLPNVVNVLVGGMESETLILQLDLAGFAVSGGSACSSGSLEPSHVLTALGIPRDKALCSLRISMGRYTAEDDVTRFIGAFRQLVG